MYWSLFIIPLLILSACSTTPPSPPTIYVQQHSQAKEMARKWQKSIQKYYQDNDSYYIPPRNYQPAPPYSPYYGNNVIPPADNDSAYIPPKYPLHGTYKKPARNPMIVVPSDNDEAYIPPKYPVPNPYQPNPNPNPVPRDNDAEYYYPLYFD